MASNNESSAHVPSRSIPPPHHTFGYNAASPICQSQPPIDSLGLLHLLQSRIGVLETQLSHALQGKAEAERGASYLIKLISSNDDLKQVKLGRLKKENKRLKVRMGQTSDLLQKNALKTTNQCSAFRPMPEAICKSSFDEVNPSETSHTSSTLMDLPHSEIVKHKALELETSHDLLIIDTEIEDIGRHYALPPKLDLHVYGKSSVCDAVCSTAESPTSSTDSGSRPVYRFSKGLVNSAQPAATDEDHVLERVIVLISALQMEAN